MPYSPALPTVDLVEFESLLLKFIQALVGSVGLDGSSLASPTAAAGGAFLRAIEALEEDPYLLGPLLQIGLVLTAGLYIIANSGNSDFTKSSASSSTSSSKLIRDGAYDAKYAGEVYRRGVYDAEDAKEYFSTRPVMALTRSSQIASKSALFLFSLLGDYLLSQLEANEARRADELADLLTALGPAFIKIGQSLSVRTDLLRPAYIRGLAKLQDKVPSFPTSQAREIIKSELGRSADEIFVGLSFDSQVVAAASLGQVYKATLRSTNSQVAVKIQRPSIIENVALDLHIIRSAAPTVKKIARLQSDLIGILDQWGEGFVNELDYEMEAKNAQLFNENIASTPLGGVVFAPNVVPSASSRKVLTTEWVEGERLEQSSAKDIASLCSIAMNTYLTMMLEFPLLHADPHPGNLKRTPDGRLCILDWGLVTSLEPDIRLTLIEHIAHLTSKDYAKVPGDLVKLGFIPIGMEGAAQSSGVVEVLADVYGEWAGGGGAAKIDVQAVIKKLSGLTEQYGNLFQLPPYFAYIAKAFGVLEGIGLAADPNYAIVGECMPYVAKRLLTDPNERTGGALGAFLFGKDVDSEQDRLLDLERVELLVKGFGSYNKATAGLAALPSASSSSSSSSSPSSSTSSSSSSSSSSTSTSAFSDQVEQTADLIASLVLGESSSSSSNNNMLNALPPPPFQRLLIEEGSKIIGAFSRSQFAQLRKASGRLPTGRTVLGTLVITHIHTH